MLLGVVPPVPGVPDDGPIVGNSPDGFWPLVVGFSPPVWGNVTFPSGELLPVEPEFEFELPELPECPCPCDEVLVGVGVGVGDVGGDATMETEALPVIEPVVLAPGAAAVTVAASVAVSPEGALLGTAIWAWS